MSTDAVREFLAQQFTDTTASGWKRRSKKAVTGGQERTFEHAGTSRTVTVLEAPDGSLTLTSGPSPTPTKEEAIASFARHMPSRERMIQMIEDEPDLPCGAGRLHPDAIAMRERYVPEPGETIQIAKGTILYGIGYGEYFDPNRMEAKRATTAKVVKVLDMAKKWINFAEDDVREKVLFALRWVRPDFREDSLRYVSGWMEDREHRHLLQTHDYLDDPTVKKALEEGRAWTLARYGGDMRFVTWGAANDLRATHISNVTPVAAKEKVAKERAITKRKLMVIGSKWRFTKDVDIDLWISNPEIWRLVAKRDALKRDGNRTIHQGGQIVVVLGGGEKNTPAEEAEIARIQKQINSLPSQVNMKVATIKAGTVIEIARKLYAPHSYGSERETNGLLVPATVVSGDINVINKGIIGWQNQFEIPYRQIEAVVEADEVPETLAYVLRDSATGQYFAGWMTEPTGWGNRDTNTPKFSETLSGAKKYATTPAAKSSIMSFTGYTDGLDYDGESGPEYMDGRSFKMDLPETWEMVEFDKTTNTIKRTIDVQDWYRDLMRLRVLTQKYGSAARNLYKQVEGKGMEAAIIFQSEEPWADFHSDEYLAQIKQAVRQFESLPDTVRVRTKASICYATTLDNALLGKMSYAAPEGMTCTVLDLNTLQEVVG